MKDYRIFVEDRSPGLYSALCGVAASSRVEAEAAAKKKYPPHHQSWGVEKYHAVEWPALSVEDTAWLAVHVGPNL